MFLVTLKREWEANCQGGNQIVVASPMAILKDGIAPSTQEEDEIRFNDEGVLVVPETILITEDTRFLLDTGSDTAVIMDPSPMEGDDCTCNGNGICKCGSGNFYYAVVSDSEKPVAEGDLDRFTVEMLLMRNDTIAPQFVIGYAKDDMYVIPIEREMFENLSIGDDIPVYMDEYYNNTELPFPEPEDDETEVETETGFPEEEE